MKVKPLLATPPTVTTTGPAPSGVPAGTLATTLFALQLVIVVACLPLNLTVLEPWEAPKFEPEMVTLVPPVPEVGFKPLMPGTGALKITPLVPELIGGLPSGVEVVTGNCALPAGLVATLTAIMNMGIPLVRPGTAVELVQVMFCPEAVQLQLPAVTEA